MKIMTLAALGLAATLSTAAFAAVANPPAGDKAGSHCKDGKHVESGKKAGEHDKDECAHDKKDTDHDHKGAGHDTKTPTPPAK